MSGTGTVSILILLAIFIVHYIFSFYKSQVSQIEETTRKQPLHRVSWQRVGRICTVWSANHIFVAVETDRDVNALLATLTNVLFFTSNVNFSLQTTTIVHLCHTLNTYEKFHIALLVRNVRMWAHLGFHSIQDKLIFFAQLKMQHLEMI